MSTSPSAAPESLPIDVATALHELRSQCRRLRLVAVAAMLGVIALGLSALADRLASSHVLRTRGIVIEDAEGRDRILIGMPVPQSASRMRTDPARVEKEWAPRMGGEEYMKAYREYDHSVGGILMLNEQGFDTLMLAEHTPDPNTGKRLFQNSGFTWNDDRGFELGGLGCGKTADGKHRVILGMDDPQGEAVHLFALEDGTKGLRIASSDMLLLAGRARAGNEIFGNSEEFGGWMIKNKAGEVMFDQNVIGK
jgi:hypothetical protein